MSRRQIRAERRQAEESKYIAFMPADDTDDDEPEAGQWELPEDQKPQE